MRRPGWAAGRCIAAIERYRRRGAGGGSGCRFEPSCSTFALQAFRERAFLVALVSTAWRLVRCNPLAHAGTRDPARRRRARARANGPATAFALMSLAGLFLMLFAAVASSQTLTGGCTATVNGADPTTLTRSDPIVVQAGGSVRVKGAVPASVTLPDDQIQSNTTIQVSIVEGVGDVTSSDHPGTGREWGGAVGVDDYLKWGVGLYRVEGVATGTGGWTCSASGYVKLDGNPLTKPIGQAATGLVVVGSIGAIGSTLTRREPDVSASLDRAPSAQDVRDQFGRDVDNVLGVKPDRPKNTGYTSGCGILLALIATSPWLIGGPLAGAAVAARRGGQTVWRHGHPIVGAVSGLLLGIGFEVLGQQYALWPLTIYSAIVVPVACAILCGIRAWLGTPYRAVPGAGPATLAPPPMAPPMAPPMP